MAAGRFDEAQQQMESALALATDDKKSQVRTFLGLIYLGQKQYEKAIAQYQTVVADPTLDKTTKTAARMGLTSAYIKAGEPAKARAQAQIGLEEGADNATVQAAFMVAVGDSYLAERLYPQAQQNFEKALFVPGSSPDFASGVKNKIGVALLFQEDYGAATEVFEEMLAQAAPEKQPGNPILANLFQTRANEGLAQVHFGQALEREQEAMRLSSLSKTTATSQEKARQNIVALQTLRDRFLEQFVPKSPLPIAPTTAAETVGQPQAP